MSNHVDAGEVERRGLRAWERWGFYHLSPLTGGPFLARGSTLAEAFERLESVHPEYAADPPATKPVPPEFVKPCPKCRAAAGEKCRNYKGQNKQTCPARLKPAETKAPPAETIATAGETKPMQRSLFDELE